MEIKIKLKDGAICPCKSDNGDWIDLYTSENVSISKNQYYEIPLGVAMELPKGYEALVAPRSSTFKKYGLIEANSIGIIDESYKGDNDYWRLPVYSTRNVFIEKGTRLCQFRVIEHQPSIRFSVVSNLGNPDRNGIGSTGD